MIFPFEDFISVSQPHRVRRLADRIGPEIVITPGDDWKGEHLIRAPRREEPVPAVEPVKKLGRRRRPPQGDKPTAQICAVPGCESRLSKQNDRGVCHLHQHRRGFCHCDACLGRPKKIKPGERR
jgi:hypothetical protein